MKQRQNTNQKQRIVAFVGSPLNSNTTKESLKDLGLIMKKNGVAIDLIDFGTENRGNTEILNELINAIDTEAHPSRLITIESEGNNGIFLLDSLKSKVPELFNRSSSSSTNNNSGDNSENGFDFDPELDPELAMALKLSMEEEVNRQKKVGGAGIDESDNEKYVDVDEDMENENEDEDEELARAIALSMEQEKKEQQK